MKYRVIQTIEILDSLVCRFAEKNWTLDSAGSVISRYSLVYTLLKKKVFWQLVFAIAPMFVFCEKIFFYDKAKSLTGIYFCSLTSFYATGNKR